MGRKRSRVPLVRFNMLLAETQRARIDVVCERTGLDRTAVIRLALDAYLDREEKWAAKREDR